MNLADLNKIISRHRCEFYYPPKVIHLPIKSYFELLDDAVSESFTPMDKMPDFDTFEIMGVKIVPSYGNIVLDFETACRVWGKLSVDQGQENPPD